MTRLELGMADRNSKLAKGTCLMSPGNLGQQKWRMKYTTSRGSIDPPFVDFSIGTRHCGLGHDG
jgi:hypothetical protein